MTASIALRDSSGASFSDPLKLVVLTPFPLGKVTQWSLYHPFGGESNHTNGNFDGFPEDNNAWFGLVSYNDRCNIANGKNPPNC